MSATVLVILCQTTFVLSIGILAIRLLRYRHVELAASIGNLISISAAVLVIACCLGLPRPLSIELGKQWNSSSHPMYAESILLEDTSSQERSNVTTVEPFNATLITFGFGSHYKAQVESSSWIGDYVGKANDWSSCIVFLAIGLFAIFLGRLSLGLYTAMRLTAQGVCLPEWQWPKSVRSFHGQHFEKITNVKLKVHAGIHSPCVHALSRNTIFVPPGFLNWSDEEAVSAFAHEFAHLRRRDSLWRFLGELCLSLVALHPLSHWMRRQAVMAQELATDLMAAELLGNSRLYQIGLSRLLLRLDRQPNGFDWRLGYGVGVSMFSSSLIRRIEMLGQGQRFKAETRRRLSWFFLTTACIGVALCGSWGVVADEPPRVAARPASSGKKVESRLFAKEMKEISGRLSGQTGFVHVNLAAGKSHPAIKMVLDFAQQVGDQRLWLPVDGKRPSHSEFGLDFNEIDSVEAGLQVVITAATGTATDATESSTPQELEPNGDSKFQLTLGSNAFRIKTQRIVDWPKLVAALDPVPFGPAAGDLAGLAESLEPTNDLSIGFQEATTDNATSTNEATMSKPELAAIWNTCDGGFIAMAALIPEDNPLNALMDDPEQFQQLTEEQKQISTAVRTLSAIAVGVDFEPGQPALTVRIVLQAKAGVEQSQLLDVAGKLRAVLATEVGETGGGRMLVKAIFNAPLEALAGEDGQSFVAIQFAHDPILAMVIGN